MGGGAGPLLEEIQHGDRLRRASALGLPAAGEGLAGPSWINAATKGGTFLNGEARGANVAEDHGAIAQLNAAGSANFSVELAGDDNVLCSDVGLDTAFG